MKKQRSAAPVSAHPFSARAVAAAAAPDPGAATTIMTVGLRRFLYLTAAVTGAVVLVVEILGAKMLAPFFGTSHFVWTAQIGVTLMSLAGGYAFGGWLVDRSQSLHRLYACLAGAALYLAMAVLLCEPVATICLDAGRLAAGSILASAFLFFVPLTLLAATGPFVIRVLTSSVNEVGGQVGRLYSISTVGSVVGTLLIGYVLVPFLPNSVTMFLTAGTLLLLALVYFVAWARHRRQILAAVAVAIVAAGLGGAGVARDQRWRSSDSELLMRANSNFGDVQVIRDKKSGYLYYLNDYLTQNGIDPATGQSIYLFAYMLRGLARAYTDRLDDVLVIGLGVGTVPMQLAREGAKVDVVEINPAVVPLAERYFGLEPSLMNIAVGDGRSYLRGRNKKYDAVLLDAFLGDSSPSHLMTREAFEAMRALLKPDGVLVIDTFGEIQPGRDFLISSLSKTLRAVFPTVNIHTSGSASVFFVASSRPTLVFKHQPDVQHVHREVAAAARRAYENVVHTDVTSGRILTDDHNPVEYHEAAYRETLRRLLAIGALRMQAAAL